MRAPLFLFLQACDSFRVRLGCGHHLVNRSCAVIFRPSRGYFPISSRSSFAQRSVDLQAVTHPRTVFSRAVAMAQTQDSSMDPPAHSEAMLAKGKLIMQRLEEVYPKAPEGFLHHRDPFTLLIAVVLSAQSLDVKVNEITPRLFKVGRTPEQMRELGETRIREIIKQIGLAPQKAKNIAKLSDMICEQFDGNVPHTFEGLESLPGVGHKTASVVMMQAFDKPAFPVDTHIHRLACRWGCGDAKSVKKTEAALKMWFPDPSTWGSLHTRIILFGREHCPARKHDMDQCPICSFAATDEAWSMNRQHPNKFISAKSHKNPYSIRDVPRVDPADKDPSYSPVQKSTGRKKRKSTKTRALEQREENGSAEKRPSSRRRKVEGEVESQEGDDGIELPAKRVRRGRRGKAVASSSIDEMTGEDGGGKDIEEEGKTSRRANRIGRGKREESNINAEDLLQANEEAPRRSSRVRAKKEVDASS